MKTRRFTQTTKFAGIACSMALLAGGCLDADSKDPLRSDDLTTTQQAVGTWNGGYHRVSEVKTDMNALQTAKPNLVQVVDYGDSYAKTVGGITRAASSATNMQVPADTWAGEDLLAYRLTNRTANVWCAAGTGCPASPASKPKFFLVSAVHGREIATTEMALNFASWLANNYGTNGDATMLLDYYEIWVVPLANPDGHHYTEIEMTISGQSDGYYWRKNGRVPTTACSDTSAHGVDLNRNFPFHFRMGSGTVNSWSTNTCDRGMYSGAAASSEPEVTALTALIRQQIPDQRVENADITLDTNPAGSTTAGFVINMHQYGNKLSWPWGATMATSSQLNSTTTPWVEEVSPNEADLTLIGTQMADVSKYGSWAGYTTVTNANHQGTAGGYHVAGSLDEWAYGELGVPGVLMEAGPNTFVPSFSSIGTNSGLWPGMSRSLLHAAKLSRQPYTLARGPQIIPAAFPDGTSHASKLTASYSSGTLTLTFFEDDSRSGGDRVVPLATKVCIDRPCWAGGTVRTLNVPNTVLAQNATVSGTVSGTIPTGTHIVFVEACDDHSPNYYCGPPSAVMYTATATAPSGGTAQWPPITSLTLDDGSGGTSSAGTWGNSACLNAWADDSKSTTSLGSSTWYKFTFQNVAAGIYDIRAHWTNQFAATVTSPIYRATSVPFTFFDGTNTNALNVDQSINGGQWNTLWAAKRITTATPWVQITAASQSGKSTCADAIELVKRNELIIDDGMTGSISKVGTWADDFQNFNSYNYKSTYRTSTGTGEYFQWNIPTFQHAGNWDVYVRWTTGTSPARSTAVTYQVFNGTGPTNMGSAVNQSVNGGVWTKLSTVNFPSTTATNYYIRMLAPSSGSVSADAIKLVPAP